MNVLTVDSHTLPARSKDGRNQASELRNKRIELTRKLKAVEAHNRLPVAEAHAASVSLLHLRNKVNAQWAAQREYRQASKRNRPDDSTEEVFHDLSLLTERLEDAFSLVEQQSARVATPLRDSLARETSAIKTASREHAALASVGDAVLHAAEVEGAKALDGFLVGAIRQADMGLADAAWNELLDTVMDREDAMRERNEKLHFLSDTMDDLRRRSR